VREALAAAEELAEEGIEASVVNARFIKPLDEELICSLAKSVGRIVTVEEGILVGGFGAGVVEALADRGLAGVGLTRLGIGDSFVACGDRQRLLAQWRLDPEGIAGAAAALCRRDRSSASAAAF